MRRSNRLKYYYFRYQRLVEQHLSDEDEDKAPRIYVTAMVGQERKRYDVPLIFKWDFDEGNYFIFLKKFEKWSGVRGDYLASANAALIQNSNHSSPVSIAES
ncbi:hypothetical protein Goshw_021636 [Gossypium schwendimanii]|uniref:Uncharacterized protein n=1 Tax=Gossypium schwendimanii TaxID=34291 RepID=A0A7J9LBA1_GOSSC|nr:hypothetical protein [Gossypium schwendimanii]